MNTPAAPSGEATSGNRLDDLLPEDTQERSQFDQATARIYHGDVLLHIQEILGLWSKMSPQNGSYSMSLAIMRNELAKLRVATPAPESPNVVTIPRLSAEKAVRAMALCDREHSGWGKYAKPIVDALAASQGAAQAVAAQATEQKGDSRIASSLGRFEVGYDPSADRSAKAVAPDAWQFLGSSPQSGITEPFPTGRWRECLDPEAAKDAGYEVRPLWTHPPAQPASPGPLQPGVTDEMVDAAIDGYASCGKGGTHFEAIRAALEAALSADHDAKEAK